MRGLTGNLSDPTVASSPYDILFFYETLVSYTVYASRVGVADSRFLSPCLVSGQDASGPRDGCIRTRWLGAFSPTKI